MPQDTDLPAPSSSLLIAELRQSQQSSASQNRAGELLRDRSRAAARRFLDQGLRQTHDSEDVAQDAVLRALSGIESFEVGRPGGWRAWLDRIVKNLVIDLRRHLGAAKRGGTVGQTPPASDGSSEPARLVAAATPSPSEQASRSECLHTLGEILDCLPATQREVVVLKSRGATFGEISQLLSLESARKARHLHDTAISRIEGVLIAEGHGGAER